MDTKLYLQFAAVEDVHWWFVGRRIILNKIVAKLPLPDEAEIFEAGCGTGGNLGMLSRYGAVYAMELDKVARSFASERRLAQLEPGR